ncbi:transmembrane protein [Perilla frutescens var. frutescens]|nr:transmembrane protein [Perilla frutescens var. frutescens]
MSSSSVTTFPPNPSSSSTIPRASTLKYGLNKPQAASFRRLHGHTDVSLRVANERAEASPDATSERSEADKIVDGMDFGELCNEFECISSPLVESTARQLVRDILQLRQGNRALGSYAVSVKYKDPVRSFTGRDKYKRQLWATDALENPTVSVQQMVMLSTSELNIKWTLRGKPKSPIFTIGGDLIIKVNSKFTLNQISGQVVEHQESWDLSQSSLVAQAYFWASRRLFATVEAGKDVSDSIKDVSQRMTKENKNVEMYPDPTGDPTKFFQRDDGFQRDLYQVALFLAVVYFVVQFLQTTL